MAYAGRLLHDSEADANVPTPIGTRGRLLSDVYGNAVQLTNLAPPRCVFQKAARPCKDRKQR